MRANGGMGQLQPHRQALPPSLYPASIAGAALDGCLDATCGARGLEKIHHHMHDATLPAEDILAHWLEQEPAACRTVDVYLDILSAPLAMILNTTAATIIPVGGGLSNVPELITAIDKAARGRMLVDPEIQLVVPAQNQLEPGLVGATILGLRHLS